jgi:hypothetical protein
MIYLLSLPGCYCAPAAVCIGADTFDAPLADAGNHTCQKLTVRWISQKAAIEPIR